MIPMPAKAYGFIGLNAVRALSILTLLLVFSSTIVVMAGDIQAIKKGSGSHPPSGSTVSINGTDYYYDCDYLENSTVPLQPGGSMFAIINHLFVIFQCILLILSELSWPSKFFDEFVPVLGRAHGPAILGFMQIFIGAAVLSHHVDTFALVSAFFCFAVGILNVILGAVFRARVKTIRSLKPKEHIPTLPKTAQDMDFRAMASKGGSVFSAGGSIFTHITGQTQASRNDTPAPQPASTHNISYPWSNGAGFGRQNEKAGGLRGA